MSNEQAYVFFVGERLEQRQQIVSITQVLEKILNRRMTCFVQVMIDPFRESLLLNILTFVCGW